MLRETGVGANFLGSDLTEVILFDSLSYVEVANFAFLDPCRQGSDGRSDEESFHAAVRLLTKAPLSGTRKRFATKAAAPKKTNNHENAEALLSGTEYLIPRFVH